MEKYKYLIIIILLSVTVNLFSSEISGVDDCMWGDQGNGTYINPVLYADYSDPDVIRVGKDFYMVCSEFHFMGMPVLHSKDLVNWTIVGRVYREFKFSSKYDTNGRYAGGSWAPAIRYHNKKFYVYFCTPKEGLFMSLADKPEGPWAPLVQVVKIKGWEDPCPFWDEDGQAYLGHSKVGAGPIIIHKMSSDGKKLLDEGVQVYSGPVAEGTKIYKRNGRYYLSIPEGGVKVGWQTVLRSKNIYGPYERKVVLERGSTNINGPHQGSMVDLPNGDWWFLHFQSKPNAGRILHLQPMYWKEGWPVIGIDIDRNGIGEPVYVWKKPDTGKSFPVEKPQTSDEFNMIHLGLQWEWNHNPVDSAWSLSQNRGLLKLNALKADSLMKAKNTLTQKIMGPAGEVVTSLYAGKMKNGQRAGLCLIGKTFNEAGLIKKNGNLFVYVDINGKYSEKPYNASIIYIKAYVSQRDNSDKFYYSSNNKDFIPLCSPFTVANGYWKGPRSGLFSFNPEGNGGTALFDWFHYSYDCR